MKNLLISALFLASTYAAASEIKINTWYKLNSQTQSDTAAEVCFSLIPAPTAPIYAQVTVDPGTRVVGYYGTWIDQRGSACLVVSSNRGRVEVQIPELKLSSSKSL